MLTAALHIYIALLHSDPGRPWVSKQANPRHSHPAHKPEPGLYHFANLTAAGRSLSPRAEVIKVEHPVRGDDTRAWGPPYAKYKPESDRDGPGESAYFLGVR